MFFILSTDVAEDPQGSTPPGESNREIDREIDLLALARALSTSPWWKEIPGATLLVRLHPRPALGVVGRFDAAAEARMAVLGSQLTTRLAHLRYVDYSQAEEDCELLAAQLTERFGREELARFRFAAVPRGGLIVLGMLAYALGLEHAQLEPPYPPEGPLVVVDDCALSGSRFGRFLRRCESHEVIFAHLYSHPELRANIEARESVVTACLAARDLRDHAPERLGAEYAVWRERWRARRADGPHYWSGQPDYVAFAWNEPDLAIWNSVNERIEQGWRIIPPELCLKNRHTPGTVSIPVQVQPTGKWPLRPSAHVLFGEFEERVVLGNLESKTSFSLDGVAADMWRAVVEHGNLKDAANALSQEYEVAAATLQADFRDFTEDLVVQGLLERNRAPTPVR